MDTREVGTPFLRARWESLLLLNFDCSPELLAPLVPAGTELDPWNGAYILSLVGFNFANTRVLGFPIPGHRGFEEVNLRFYVRRRVPESEDRRAVVFIRELVPRRAIAWAARLLYNEPYSAAPMAHHTHLDPEAGGVAEYHWWFEGAKHSVLATVAGPAAAPRKGSEAEFITEHYWGYTRQRDGGTLEYRVDHPSWTVWEATEVEYRTPTRSRLYPPEFGGVLAGEPRSAFVAMGSEVTVFRGRRLSGVG